MGQASLILFNFYWNLVSKCWSVENLTESFNNSIPSMRWTIIEKRWCTDSGVGCTVLKIKSYVPSGFLSLSAINLIQIKKYYSD